MPSSYETVKAKVETLQREADRATGSLQQLMSRLKEEHNCSNVRQAESKLKQLERELVEVEAEYEQDLEAFEEEIKAHPILVRVL